jgi:hypothetical protein
MEDFKVPDPRDTMKKKREAEQEKYREEREKARLAISRFCATEDGKFFLSWLCAMSGFGTTSLVFSSTGDIATNLMLAREARVGLYLDIRKLIPNEIRSEIEKPRGEENA